MLRPLGRFLKLVSSFLASVGVLWVLLLVGIFGELFCGISFYVFLVFF